MIMVLIRGGIETLQLGTYYYIYILATYLIVLKEKLVFLDHLPHSLKSRNRWVFHNSEVRSPGICFLSYVSSSLQQVSSYFHDMFFSQIPISALHSAIMSTPTWCFSCHHFLLCLQNFCSIKTAVIPTILSTNNYKCRSNFFLAQT